MRLYYTDQFELPLPAGHRFPMAKYRQLRQRLEAVGWYELLVPQAADDEALLRAHTPGYLHRVCEGRLSELDQKRIGFPWSEELVTRSRYSTGATICAAASALTDFVSVNLAGGTHHAFTDAGAGFCVFNDVAVAARTLQAEQKVEQVLVVDCDVHQGNGTAEIFGDDPTVFTLSLHGERNYPFRKATSDLDVALPDGTGDADYLCTLEVVLNQALVACRPNFVFYVAGADAFAGDRLGRLKLTKAGLLERDRLVFARCDQLNLPVAVSMGGGYADEIEDIVDIHAATIDVAGQFCRA